LLKIDNLSFDLFEQLINKTKIIMGLTSTSLLSDLISSSVISPSSGDEGALLFNSSSVFKFQLYFSTEHSKLFKYNNTLLK